MFRGFSVLIVALLAVFACEGNVESGAQAPAAEDRTGDSPCEGKPLPAHECGRRVRVPLCTVVGGEARWQIDCVPRDPKTTPVDTRPVLRCDEQECGAEPGWDPSDCVHGFGDTSARCKRIGSSACAWGRVCSSKRCSVDEPGTCDVVNPDKLGPSCADADRWCPTGYQCATIDADIGAVSDPVCVTSCDALTCADGKKCQVLESQPLMLACFDEF